MACVVDIDACVNNTYLPFPFPSAYLINIRPLQIVSLPIAFVFKHGDFDLSQQCIEGAMTSVEHSLANLSKAMMGTLGRLYRFVWCPAMVVDKYSFFSGPSAKPFFLS